MATSHRPTPEDFTSIVDRLHVILRSAPLPWRNSPCLPAMAVSSVPVAERHGPAPATAAPRLARRARESGNRTCRAGQEGRARPHHQLDHLRQRGLGLWQPEGHVHGARHINSRRQRSTDLLPLTFLGIQVYTWVGNGPLNSVDPTELSTEGGLFTTTRQHVKPLVLGLSYTDVQEVAFEARLATGWKKACGQCGVEYSFMGPQWLWRDSP